MRPVEGVPGGRIGAGDLVEHPARGGEAGGGVRGEELVPGRGGGGAGLEERGVGLGGGGEGVVLAAAHAQLYRLRPRWTGGGGGESARARAFAEPGRFYFQCYFHSNYMKPMEIAKSRLELHTMLQIPLIFSG